MKLDFQRKVVAYLYKDPRALNLKRYLDKGIVDHPALQELIQIWLSHVKKYKKIPDETIVSRIIEKEAERENITPETLEDLTYEAREVFLNDPDGLVETELVEYCQRKKATAVIDWANNKLYGKKQISPEETKHLIDQLPQKFSEVAHIGEETEDHGSFLIKDHGTVLTEITAGNPCKFSGLNRLTSAGGFHTPQNIVFMGPPKAGKTALLLNIAIDYVIKGLNVYYVDYENGQEIIRNKSHQHLLNCTREEIYDYGTELSELLSRIKSMGGGDLYIGEYKARRDTLGTVKARLNYLEYEYGWVPDVIIYDYLDLAEVDDKSITERRLKIQQNYHEAVSINKELGTFSITVSKVKQNAFKKGVLDLEDFGEDSEKAYNAHSAFAFVKPEDETEQSIGLRYLQVVAQREGVSPEHAPHIPLLFDGARIQLDELSRPILERLQQGENVMDLITEARSTVLNDLPGRGPENNLNDQIERDSFNVEF